ncbi:MAG: hypothetical protein R3B93_20125 [Bacteroidia bacterium]
MKLHFLIILSLLLSLPFGGYSQNRMSLEVGYYGNRISQPGATIGFEYDKSFTGDFSSPLRLNIGFFKGPEYNVLFLEVHKGFRKKMDSGLFLEQSIGVGAVANFFTLESMWYSDPVSGSIFRYKEGANWGISPSVTVGAGYSPKNSPHSFWIRPKVYWNFFIRGLQHPYGALQIGYSYTFKSN